MASRAELVESTGTTRYAWDGIRVLKLEDEEGTLKQRQVHGHSAIPSVGDIALMESADGDPYGPIADQVGTVVKVLSSGATVANSYQYDAFGVSRGVSESFANRFRFAGKPLDPDSSLYHFIAREYMASQGRFLAGDPLPSPTGLGRYAYVLQAPLSLVDPHGRQSGWEVGPWKPQPIIIIGPGPFPTWEEDQERQWRAREQAHRHNMDGPRLRQREMGAREDGEEPGYTRRVPCKHTWERVFFSKRPQDPNDRYHEPSMCLCQYDCWVDQAVRGGRRYYWAAGRPYRLSEYGGSREIWDCDCPGTEKFRVPCVPDPVEDWLRCMNWCYPVMIGVSLPTKGTGGNVTISILPIEEICLDICGPDPRYWLDPRWVHEQMMA